MTYKALYDFCQDLTPPIHRNVLRDRVLNLARVNQVRVFRASLDVSLTRGQYLSSRNTESRFVQQAGGHVIVLARGMNRCWERFVFVKELMHLLDSAEHATDTGDAFEKLLRDFAVGPPSVSPQMRAEIDCYWKALGVLCPEGLRLEFASERAQGRMDDYAIALRLLIPQAYVPNLFRRDFPDIIRRMIDPPAKIAVAPVAPAKRAS